MGKLDVNPNKTNAYGPFLKWVSCEEQLKNKKFPHESHLTRLSRNVVENQASDGRLKNAITPISESFKMNFESIKSFSYYFPKNNFENVKLFVNENNKSKNYLINTRNTLLQTIRPKKSKKKFDFNLITLKKNFV